MSIASEMYKNSLRESDLSKTVQNQILEYATAAKEYDLLITLASYPGLDYEIDRKLSVHKNRDVRIAWLHRRARSQSEIDEFVSNCKGAGVLMETLRGHGGNLSDKSARVVLDRITKSEHLIAFIIYISTKRVFKLEALRKLAECEPIFGIEMTSREADLDSFNFNSYLTAIKRFPEIADELARTAKSPFLTAAAATAPGVGAAGKNRAVSMITKWYADQVAAMGGDVARFYGSRGFSVTDWLQDVLKELAKVKNFEAEPVIALNRVVLDHLKDITTIGDSDQIHRSLKYMLEMRHKQEEPIEFDWIRDCSSVASLSNTLEHVLTSFDSDFNKAQRVASIKQIVQHPLASKAIMAKAAKGLDGLEVGALMHSYLRSDSAKLAAWLSGSSHIANHSVMSADDPEDTFSRLLNDYCEIPAVAQYLMESDLLTEESARKLDASVVKVLAEKKEPWQRDKTSPVIGKLITKSLTTPASWKKFEDLGKGFNGTLGQLLDQAVVA